MRWLKTRSVKPVASVVKVFNLFRYGVLPKRISFRGPEFLLVKHQSTYNTGTGSGQWIAQDSGRRGLSAQTMPRMSTTRVAFLGSLLGIAVLGGAEDVDKPTSP